MKKIILLCAAFWLLTGFLMAQKNIVELTFKSPDSQKTPQEKTLESLVVVREISEQYATGGLYLMSHYGDREELFRKENQSLIDNPFLTQSWRFCSVYSTQVNDEILMGRNWDNQNVGSIIVSLYQPENGYSSITFSRAIDIGFPLNIRLENMTGAPFGDRFMTVPFNSMDGINEHGLSVAIAGIKDIPVKEQEGKELIFISYLVLKILTHTKTVGEAIKYVENYIPFLLNKSLVEGHLLISDANGKSVILEYLDDSWKVIPKDQTWQVMTNKVMYGLSDSELKEKCWRYKSISETMEKHQGNIDWKQGLGILKDVAQKGTTWSSLYLPKSKEIYFTVYQSWDQVYHITFPETSQ